MKNWKRAIFQALQYKAFSNYVFTVFPKQKEVLIIKNIDSFKRFGVGVIIFDHENKQIFLVNEPSKNEFTSEIHSLTTFSNISRKKNISF